MVNRKGTDCRKALLWSRLRTGVAPEMLRRYRRCEQSAIALGRRQRLYQKATLPEEASECRSMEILKKVAAFFHAYAY